MYSLFFDHCLHNIPNVWEPCTNRVPPPIPNSIIYVHTPFLSNLENRKCFDTVRTKNKHGKHWQPLSISCYFPHLNFFSRHFSPFKKPNQTNLVRLLFEISREIPRAVSFTKVGNQSIRRSCSCCLLRLFFLFFLLFHHNNLGVVHYLKKE